MEYDGIVFLDTEVGVNDHRVHDIGALRADGVAFHSSSVRQLGEFVAGARYVCGHNVVHHDAPYLAEVLPSGVRLIDTLYMSPLLFPKKPYHKLLKDDKLLSEELNNPLNDCQKARDLFCDEVAAYGALDATDKQIMGKLLASCAEYEGFFAFVGFVPDGVAVAQQIVRHYAGRVCGHADVAMLAQRHPCALAYALALVRSGDSRSVTPPWVLHNFPEVENVHALLRHTPCTEGCPYCDSMFDVRRQLKRFFGYDQFRLFDGRPLQEEAAKAAVAGQSLLAIFPTGGGKSLTFQLPALMEGEAVHGLTVVISPLQSLMKDQVDNLAERGIVSAVTINGLLDPVSRADAVRRVADGSASLLYISPEMLRSKTVAHLLEQRCVVRFVIDEAHCFSAWGQDFRVDYLYIGQFIANLQERKGMGRAIPVSCFTATAKQKVIADICDYFKYTLNVELRLFASDASRHNLHYSVIHVDGDEEKYVRLRSLIGEVREPTIVYVSRTRRTVELAHRLTRDGYKALPFNGKMDANEKVANQNAFMNGEVGTIVATSAFGMGVDKKDVGLVVHYDISDSLENYVQEAGRAGRDPQMQARCFVLFGDQDLDKHFVLLNQTKLSISEIQQVWRAIKKMTAGHQHICCSALEIARQAGWDDGVGDMETRVRTAVSALEQAGYVSRGDNVPHVYATGIQVKNMDEAHARIDQSSLFSEEERRDAVRIIKSLITNKNTAGSKSAEAESRIDYLADILGLTKATVVSVVERMRQEGILADSRDMSVRLSDEDTEKRSLGIIERFARLERFLMSTIPPEGLQMTMKQLNDQAVSNGVATSTEKNLRTLINFLVVKGYLTMQRMADTVILSPTLSREVYDRRCEQRMRLSRFLLERLYAAAALRPPEVSRGTPLMFSIVEMLRQYQSGLSGDLFAATSQMQLTDIEEALLYLSKVGALRLEGGFLVLYNAMEIHRIKDMRNSYRQEDYRLLNEFYKQKIQQIHIVGEYANLMVRDYDAALEFVQDYFQMDHRRFIAKYFKGERAAELEKNITPAKYQQLFGQLSARQREIINDKQSRYIVVAAGPGSGKTRVLVHKMASLLMLEEVKHEQLLMLTFSRAAASEFKKRLLDLIGGAAHFVEIKTFHAYCFDLLGRIGNLEEVEEVVPMAAKMIAQGEVEPSRISKTVLLIDEAQDMDAHEYDLVQALMHANEEMRVIAVGDDDQNVFQFRGADSRYMRSLVVDYGARLYEMTDNYRSSRSVVALANVFATTMRGRMKSTPIVAVQSFDGEVAVVEHHQPHMEIPLVRHICATHGAGTACVLTNTNDEALRITALLRRHKVPCRLIRSMDGFRFCDLAEVRYLLKSIERNAKSPVIDGGLWQSAKAALQRQYVGSSCLDAVMAALADFAQVNRTMYVSDLREFFFEASIEDFLPHSGGEVVVSTIHKAKGLEFDTVYMYVSASRDVDDDYRRQLYVGLTRAKNRLFIHSGDGRFANFGVQNYAHDYQPYPMPEEVVLSLTHRDVFLDYFKDKKQTVLALRSGELLHFAQETLYNQLGKPVARLSAKSQAELADWIGRGYQIREVRVRYVVAWHPTNTPKEASDVAVLLADMMLVSGGEVKS